MPATIESAWSRHDRRWKGNLYVYAVVSRRSGGVSIGINLNPDKTCNFDCVYCQVDRRRPGSAQKVNLKRLADELDDILQSEKAGLLYEVAPFNVLKAAERGVRDIAFSGDGEPTLFPPFESAVRIAAQARIRFGLESAKLVLLTNAALLHRSAVRAGLNVLDGNNGEIWAKLDAGTREYFRMVNRPRISLAKILANILDASRVRPLVIQSLWFRINGRMPSPGEIEAYCERLSRMIAAGGRFKALQLYTIARPPAEAFASPLSNEELARIAAVVESRVSVPVKIFQTAMRV